MPRARQGSRAESAAKQGEPRARRSGMVEPVARQGEWIEPMARREERKVWVLTIIRSWALILTVGGAQATRRVEAIESSVELVIY